MTDLERLAVKEACQSASVEFGRLQDERRHDDLAALMTADATYVRLGEALTVDSFVAWIKTTPPNRTRHFVTPTHFTSLSNDRATGITYYTIYLYDGEGEAPYPLEGPFVVGEYHEEFVRTAEGWKIHRREARIVFRR